MPAPSPRPCSARQTGRLGSASSGRMTTSSTSVPRASERTRSRVTRLATGSGGSTAGDSVWAVPIGAAPAGTSFGLGCAARGGKA